MEFDEQAIEYWYRFEDFGTAPPLDEFERPIDEGGIIIHLRKLRVTKHTPKGVRLYLWHDESKFVLAGARKRFACPTIEEAKESFLARKKKQLSIIEHQASYVRAVIKLSDKLQDRVVNASSRREPEWMTQFLSSKS